MKIALIGATGYVGSAILNEALQRGHLVTAIARNPQQIPATEGVSIQTADVFDSKSLSDILSGHDVLVSAFSVFKSENDPKLAFKNQLKAYDNIIKSAKEARLKRLMIVGGAGALKLPSGTDLVDSPTFPAEWKEMA